MSTDGNVPESFLSLNPTCVTTDTSWCWFQMENLGLTSERSVSIHVYACMDYTYASPTKCKTFQLDFDIIYIASPSVNPPCGSEIITGNLPMPEIVYDLDPT